MIALLLAVQVAAADLATLVADVVDRDHPRERARAARELAKRDDVDLAAWLDVLRAFAPRVPHVAGIVRETADLWVDGRIEPTGVHVYVPESVDPARPAPLVLSFHGTGGSGAGMDVFWKAEADRLGMIVLAPSEAGANEGYAFSERERESALAALRWARRRWNVDEDRIFLTGISRGGHLSWDLALRHPDRFAAIAPMIGSPRFHLADGQNNLRYLENVARLPIRDLQGMKDDPGMIANLEMTFARLRELGATDAEWIQFPDRGHSFDLRAVDWIDFFGTRARQAKPERVVRAAAREGEGRAFWVEVLAYGKEVAEDVRVRVTEGRWNALDEAGRRAYLQKEVDRRTARLEVERRAPDEIVARGQEVVRFRLLLEEGDWDPKKPLRVLWNGKKVEKRPRRDARALLEEFAERFDRCFLPVATVDVP